LIAWTTYLNDNDDDDDDSDDHQQYIKYVGHKVHTVRSTLLYSTQYIQYIDFLPPRGKQKSETSCGGGSIAYGYLKRISAFVEATPSLVSESMISFNVSGLLL